jgi:hypothetical protein
VCVGVRQRAAACGSVLTCAHPFVRQELNMSLFEKAEMHQVLFVTRMAVMGFVRATCSRGGSVCKDWFDRAGKMVYWLTRNVLSVSDFVWAKEGMELELPDGSTEMDPLRGEVKLKRVKHHYHEAGYEYDMSVTADAVQAARRASWWLFLYHSSAAGCSRCSTRRCRRSPSRRRCAIARRTDTPASCRRARRSRRWARSVDGTSAKL